MACRERRKKSVRRFRRHCQIKVGSHANVSRRYLGRTKSPPFGQGSAAPASFLQDVATVKVAFQVEVIVVEEWMVAKFRRLRSLRNRCIARSLRLVGQIAE
jgi:hypothetical protein